MAFTLWKVGPFGLLLAPTLPRYAFDYIFSLYSLPLCLLVCLFTCVLLLQVPVNHGFP